LLKHLPVNRETALEIGCGTGAFSRLLADRFQQVLGLDLAPEMVRLARERSTRVSNLEYQVADVLQMDFPVEKYDCIASIATFHHLPLETMLEKTKGALKPGGVLLILDLFRSEWPQDLPMNLAAVPVSAFLKLVKTGRLREPAAVRAAWAAHGLHDVYQPLSVIRRLCAQILPGAEVQRHWLWRYSIVWKKPFGTPCVAPDFHAKFR
jgi:ubiquinone/menaquinone biosynthesis C-methylase UbiE